MPKLENTKYERWYNALIAKARSHGTVTIKIPNTEVHRIIPRCIGGTDDLENLVRFTIREHYLAHLILIRMYDGPEKYKMEWALFSMGAKPARKLILSTRQFEKTRLTLHTAMRGRKQSEEHCRNKGLALRGKNNGMHHSKGRKHPLLGKACTDERKKNISDAQKKRFAEGAIHGRLGKHFSKESKLKISLAKIGKKQSKQHIKRKSQSTSKKWKITNPLGKDFIISGLSFFCKRNDFNYSSVYSAFTHKRPYKGYLFTKLP